MTEMNRSRASPARRRFWSAFCCPIIEFHGDPLEELEGLAETAGSRVVGQLTQRREAPDVTTYLGKGKVEELQAAGRARPTPT